MWILVAQSNTVTWEHFYSYSPKKHYKSRYFQKHWRIPWIGRVQKGEDVSAIGFRACLMTLLAFGLVTVTRMLGETQGWVMNNLKIAQDNFYLNVPLPVYTLHHLEGCGLKSYYCYCCWLGNVCRGQRTALWNHFSPSTFTWVPGIRLAALGSRCLFLLSHLPSLDNQEVLTSQSAL